MNVKERDDLLSRLDERTVSIVRELQDQNQHLVKLNGRLEKHDELIIKHNTTLYEKDGLVERVGLNTRNIIKIAIIIVVISTGVNIGVTELINIFG